MSHIEIPPEAYIPCPAIGFGFRPVSRCIECNFHQGFHAVTDEPAVPFTGRYRVICNHAIARSMRYVEIEK